MSILDTAEYRRLALIAAGVDPSKIPAILDTATYRRFMLRTLRDLRAAAGYVNGSVQFYADLPVTVGTPGVNIAYLVRESSGVWFINRRPSGIYVRLFNNGDLGDWDYVGTFPEINDSQYFRIYDSADPTREVAFNVSGVSAATTRTLTVPNANGTIALTSDIPPGFDAASPPAIGNTTANSGAFTTLAANNGTLTASAPVLDLSQTWNNAAVTFTALRVNATNTASAAASSLADFQVGGTSVTAIRKDGSIRFQSGDRTLLSHPNFAVFSTAGGAWLGVNTTVSINGGFRSAGGTLTLLTAQSTDAVVLDRDAAETLAQRRGTNPQTFRLYNTYTSATNFERLNLSWASNVAIIGTEKGSGSPGGTARALEFQTDGVTRMRLTTDGTTQLSGSLQLSNQTGYALYSGAAFTGVTLNDGNNRVSLHYTGITIRNDAYYGWASSGNSAVAPDTLIRRPSAGVLQICDAGTTPRDLVLRALLVNGTTGSFPALRNSSTTLQVRLANDSAFAPLAAGLITATGNLVLTDNTGAETATFDAQAKLTANRTYDLPDSSGTIALLETLPAGGTKTYATFTATDSQPPASNFATLDTRNSIAVLDFDDATDESAVFVSIIPEAASLGSGLKIRLHWMATTATSGNVVWDVSLERMNTDLDSDSFDTIASGTAAANGTSGILTVTEITLSTIDSVTAGDGFRLKVTRDANNASDTMTNDAELVVCEVRSAA